MKALALLSMLLAACSRTIPTAVVFLTVGAFCAWRGRLFDPIGSDW